jgi:hypothetical protein
MSFIRQNFFNSIDDIFAAFNAFAAFEALCLERQQQPCQLF